MLRISRRPVPGVCLLILALLMAQAVLAEADDLPAGVSANWWSQVQRSIQLEEYAVVEDDSMEGRFRATNPAHRFEARFNTEGLWIKPTGQTGWEFGLALTGWGRPGALDTADVRWLSSDEDRVELDRGLVTEWFVNSPQGIEHGFTIPSPPGVEGDRLVFDLTLTGGLRPVFTDDGLAVDLFSNGNVSVLRYAKLVVTDATGSVLPARLDPISGGIRIVIEDHHAIYPITVDPLATSASWTATGEVDRDYFGYSVATAGDVNGDGYSDVVVGAAYFEGFRGKAYLYMGGISGLSAVAAWTATCEGGPDPLCRFGNSVATAGDVNGDGYSDVVIGAPSEGDLHEGNAYLFLGGVNGLSANPVWSVSGEGQDYDLGTSVATAGDVNGDGYSDVVIGSYNYPGGGKAYLYLGGIGGLSTSPTWTATEAESSGFGESVATAGDVNGDGYADVIIGAWASQGGRGKAHLYLGSANGLAENPSWTAAGEGTSSGFGTSVSTAGDVNGDGYSDVIVGAEPSTNTPGRAYLYMGGPGGLAAAAIWTSVGESSNDRFGHSVATAGDVNGDGYADVVVGAKQAVDFAGKAYLYLGGSGGLSAVANWSVTGELPDNDGLGNSIATAGDVNGDGFSDLLIGAAAADKVHLYLGGADGPETGTAWNATGEAAYDRFGNSVATAGDVNGDGYADVIVGAHYYSSFTGKAYLYLGCADGPATGAAWTATGEAADSYFGHSVATAGDVNGDGYSDVVVGADRSNSYTGKAYLYLGGISGLSESAGWVATGEVVGDRFGYSVATAGDANGDGYSDVVVGAYANSGSTGKAYLYTGGAGGLSTSTAWTASGEAVSDRFGTPVATAGDVNGDGYSDVVIGAERNAGSTGKAYLYLGGIGGLSTGAAWTATGEAASDFFGCSVASAGDVNGDGYSDVVVGAYGNTSSRGKAYLYLGRFGGLSAGAAWTATGELIGNYFGGTVASAGDVNGDGNSDVIVGAHANFSSRGKVYLFLGGAGTLTAGPSWTAVGEAANDRFGFSVATAGDVNGDGYSDLAVGAYGSASSAGKAHLFLGGGGAGIPILPRQWNTDMSAPITLGGMAYEQQFRLGLSLRSPMGRVWRTLQWQVTPFGGVFAPVITPIQTDPDWYNIPEALTELVPLPTDHKRYIWRARVRYHPAQSPFLPWSPWFTPSGNGLHEADIRSTSQAAPPPCSIPDEELYITTITIDGNGKPVIHYQDPNQPADVTGYNIYRAAAPTGPWTMLGSNVVDMDEGTPDNQYVDQTGDVGGPWYYEVAAWNGVCGAEGP